MRLDGALRELDVEVGDVHLRLDHGHEGRLDLLLEDHVPVGLLEEGVLLDLRDFWPVLRVWVSEFLDEVLELVRDLMVGWEL